DCDRQTLGNILLSAAGIADGLSRQLAAAVGDDAVEHYLHQTGLRLAQT
ncbi:MAG: hypothetical protein JWO88_1021, partial [Frankiales bacterium]|nr:hypothetical protein [Frankiales bacterium]